MIDIQPVEPFVLYLDNSLEPVTKTHATMARITYPDGKSVLAFIGGKESVKSYTLKTIGQIVRSFDDQLTNLVYDVWNKNSDAIDFRRAFKALLREDAPQAYIEGMREGGIDKPDEEDRVAMDEVVNDWLANQVGFVNDFAQAVADARKDKEQRAAILDRVTLWIDSLRSIGERGRAYAMNNVKADWQLGDRQTHTQDCIDLSKYKPHRVSWWTERGYIPGNERHIGCGCRLRNVATGETIMGE